MFRIANYKGEQHNAGLLILFSIVGCLHEVSPGRVRMEIEVEGCAAHLQLAEFQKEGET